MLLVAVQNRTKFLLLVGDSAANFVVWSDRSQLCSVKCELVGDAVSNTDR